MYNNQYKQKSVPVFWGSLEGNSALLRLPARVAMRKLPFSIPDHRLLMKTGDGLIFIFSAILTVLGWQVFPEVGAGSVAVANLWVIPISLILWFVVASANDMYGSHVLVDRLRSVRLVLMVGFQLILVYAIILSMISLSTAALQLHMLYIGNALLLMVMWRIMSVSLMQLTFEPRRALLVGHGRDVDRLVSHLNETYGDVYRIVGFVGHRPDETVTSLPMVGHISELSILVERLGISDIILPTNYQQKTDTFDAVLKQYENGVDFVTMSSLFERMTGRLPVEYIGDTWASILPTSANSDYKRWYYQVIKRTMDIVFAVVGLICFAAIFPFVALAIRLDSKGSIFYSQERVGLNGKLFLIHKLRTMVEDAESVTGAVFAQKDDPRITRVGRFLRKSRLDELPQLWCVLKGDMSFIGPRPERPFHVDRLAEKIPFYRTRLVARPGLTGWAQVRYGYGSDDKDALAKLEYDLYYIRNASFVMDINIMVRTVYKVVSLSGM